MDYGAVHLASNFLKEKKPTLNMEEQKNDANGICNDCGKSLLKQIMKRIQEMTWEDLKSGKHIAQCCNTDYIAKTDHKMDCVSCGKELKMCGWDPIFGEPMFQCIPCKRDQGIKWSVGINGVSKPLRISKKGNIWM